MKTSLIITGCIVLTWIIAEIAKAKDWNVIATTAFSLLMLPLAVASNHIVGADRFIDASNDYTEREQVADWYEELKKLSEYRPEEAKKADVWLIAGIVIVTFCVFVGIFWAAGR